MESTKLLWGLLIAFVVLCLLIFILHPAGKIQTFYSGENEFKAIVEKSGGWSMIRSNSLEVIRFATEEESTLKFTPDDFRPAHPTLAALNFQTAEIYNGEIPHFLYIHMCGGTAINDERFYRSIVIVDGPDTDRRWQRYFHGVLFNQMFTNTYVLLKAR